MVVVFKRFVAGALSNAFFTIEVLVVRTGYTLKAVPEWRRRIYFCTRTTQFFIFVQEWDIFWALVGARAPRPVK